MAELRDRTCRAPIPNDCSNNVTTRTKTRCEVDGLIAPVRYVRSLWTGGHPIVDIGDLAAVDIEHIPIVGGHVHHESRRLVRQLERSSRMEHGEAVARHPGGRDPTSRRRPVEYARLLRADRRRER